MSAVERTGGRTRAVVGLLAIVAALGFAGWVWWWTATRPARLVVAPTPADARVRIGEHVGTGQTELELPPGLVEIHLHAPGHRPSAISVYLDAGSQVVLTPELLPLPPP